MPATFNYKIIQHLVEALVETDGDARITQLLLEYIWDVAGERRNARVTQLVLEYLMDIPHRDCRVTQLVIEVAFKSTSRRLYLDEMGNCELSF